MQIYNITTRDKIINFLSQISHESSAGKWIIERGDKLYFEKYEPETKKGKALGNTNDGDGYKYRGAGYIQLTGKFNYQALTKEMNDNRIMEGAEYVAKNYAWTSAGFWWNNNHMNELVDSGASIEKISSRVNGRDPANGLAERKKYYYLCKNIFK